MKDEDTISTGAGVDDKRAFLVSFNKADRVWATWIAWVLEEAGYSVWFQDWDFRGNFVEHINRAHAQAHRTLAVLSDNYFGSDFTLAEWSARFAQDPAAREDRLVPVKVGPLTGETILAPIIYADLDCDEAEAQQRLLARVKKAVDPTYRPKPEVRPAFPQERPRFPNPIQNLPPRNPDFVGRENELEKLQHLLAAEQPVVLTQAITGLGGIGKTQTALAYAYRHLTRYQLIWWLRAETIAIDYAGMAKPLGLPEIDEQPNQRRNEQAWLRTQVEAVRRKLEGMKGWLLIFDNVEDPTTVREYFPRVGDGRVLVTSRRTDWQGIARPLLLDVMPEKDALQLLTGRSNPETLSKIEFAAAKALAAEQGYLPLGLAQARAYMGETGKAISSYLRLFRDSRPVDFVDERPSPDYPTSYVTTWRISIDAAACSYPAARPLLELLAFFATDPLPIEVLRGDVPALPEGLQHERECDAAIAALHRYSLVNAEAGWLTIHCLVQAVTIDELDEATAKARAEAVVQLVSASLPDPPQEHSNWPTIRILLPHALSAVKVAERLTLNLETAAKILNEVALYNKARAAWVEAESLYKHAIIMGEKTVGPEHPQFAVSLNNLAELYRVTSRFTEADPLYRRALAIREKTLGPDHPDVAQSLNNLASIYRTVGRYGEAESFLDRAIAIDEKTLGPEHPYLADDLKNLAELYRITRRYEQAEAAFKRAISIIQKSLPADHPKHAKFREHYADLLDQLGRSGEARTPHAAG
jgi:tetratricopeptide (TPR) repeat protein